MIDEALPMGEPMLLYSGDHSWLSVFHCMNRNRFIIPPQRPPSCLPEGGFKKILRLYRPRGIIKLIDGIASLYSFFNRFLDCHNGIPWPHSQGHCKGATVNAALEG